MYSNQLTREMGLQIKTLVFKNYADFNSKSYKSVERSIIIIGTKIKKGFLLPN